MGAVLSALSSCTDRRSRRPPAGCPGRLRPSVRQDNTRTLRTSLAYARHATHAGDRKLAATILKEQVDKSQGDGHPLIRSLSEAIQSGDKVGLMVSTPQRAWRRFSMASARR